MRSTKHEYLISLGGTNALALPAPLPTKSAHFFTSFKPTVFGSPMLRACRIIPASRALHWIKSPFLYADIVRLELICLQRENEHYKLGSLLSRCSHAPRLRHHYRGLPPLFSISFPEVWERDYRVRTAHARECRSRSRDL